ncbi:MAG: hypothetical protein IPN69_17540 [Acidobacteria bacterium]|nr:hypothetical protein [Acidobacteriota bacterium]MBK8147703.1 hypothetical protein [Acidobacteriota bacterium]MBK8812516.1 hypothetical protein [Acidobacteriota bacterium]
MKQKLIILSIFTALILAGATGVLAQGAKKQTKETAKVKVAKEGVGLDGIAVGKSNSNDVIKKFGKNYKLVKYKKYSAQLVYPGGISFYYCQADRKKTIFDIEFRAPYQVKTGKGITLSKSTLEDVYKIYGKSKEGLEYRGVSFFYQKQRNGKKVVTVIDIVENGGIRQCSEAK